MNKQFEDDNVLCNDLWEIVRLFSYDIERSAYGVPNSYLFFIQLTSDNNVAFIRSEKSGIVLVDIVYEDSIKIETFDFRWEYESELNRFEQTISEYAKISYGNW